MIRKLPTGGGSPTSPRVQFDDVARAAASRSVSGPPKEVVRRPRPQAGSPTTSARPPSANRSRNGPPAGRGRGPRGDATNDRERKPRQRRGGAFNAAEQEENQVEEDEDDADRSTYSMLTDDATIDRFTTLAEARAYAKVQDFVEDYIERDALLDDMANEAREKKQMDDKGVNALEEVRKDMDKQVKEALQFTSETDEAALPRHEPKEVELEGRKGGIGGATIGKAGMANSVEEGLRYIGKRQNVFGSDYVDPKELARRLVAGDFVKFRHLPERRDVLRIANNMAYSPDTPEGQNHLEMDELNDEAKKLMVGRIIKGEYKDPQDAGLSNSVLRNVARIAGGNATYTSDHKATMLKTIQSLLPAERSAGQRRPAQRK